MAKHPPIRPTKFIIYDTVLKQWHKNDIGFTRKKEEAKEYTIAEAEVVAGRVPDCEIQPVFVITESEQTPAKPEALVKEKEENLTLPHSFKSIKSFSDEAGDLWHRYALAVLNGMFANEQITVADRYTHKTAAEAITARVRAAFSVADEAIKQLEVRANKKI